jgi:hypothetical protein
MKSPEFHFIHFWSVTLVNTIKTTSFTPPSVIKLYLLFVYAFTSFGFLVGLVFLLLDEALIQQQQDQMNSKDNFPPIEEATEREPYGLRIF